TVRLHGRDAAAVRLDAGDGGVLMELCPRPVRAACEAPDDGVVPDDGAWGVVERTHDRPGRRVGEVELRTQPGDLLRVDDPRVDVEDLVHLRAFLHHAQRAVGVGERQVTVLG